MTHTVQNIIDLLLVTRTTPRPFSTPCQNGQEDNLNMCAVRTSSPRRVKTQGTVVLKLRLFFYIPIFSLLCEAYVKDSS